MLTSHEFARAAVIGAGLMGRRIAGVLASAGLEVAITDINAEILSAAAAEACEVAGAQRGSVRAASDLAAAVYQADLVIEAVVENLTVKQELFQRVAGLAPQAVLASNTSVLPIGAVTERVDDGSRVIGTHFWNPPDLIPVVEVVPTARTGPDTVERVTALLTEAGKMPVLVGCDVPGFIGNRLQHALWREAMALVAEGVCDAATVDLVVRNTIGLRLATLGPLENADYIGLDLTLAIHEAVLPSINSDPHPSPLLRRLVADGQLGARTGHGFLDWPTGARERTAARLAQHIGAQLGQDPMKKGSNQP
ncbi:3-hydroxybutyryl-CoA dehydrogenase [Mycobacterium kansasii]|uniref:Putative 3-hydroxybutyryl-CoA dehydrogenase n=1 Tax=Mycobacterium attenuatum TaxID=2341086 RepID=A0A498Q2D0_9MYCO|nr:3-hydroxyacyl-CoA dehydrogenase family protein [Mycobacterium attenuatum]ORB85466.1 3-hydroxybutyryl-CoA dehydrogenase [Mycobacterium kansasii]VBA38722.1 putative 3-hydroxybutyryl-CoA dehydrogenase [Mycobacterium attenuatum]